MVYVKLIFAYDVRWGPRFIFFLHCSNTVYWKEPIPHWIALVSLSKINWIYMWKFLSGLYSVLWIDLSIIMPILYYIDHCIFIVSIDISTSLLILFFFKILLAVLRTLNFHTAFRIVSWISFISFLGIWLVLCSIYRSIWEVLTF